jgi:prepilin-type N-terminal cleavage/methylation domain-containing protein/prepilin-type processing-associated H-X9-DG protein
MRNPTKIVGGASWIPNPGQTIALATHQVPTSPFPRKHLGRAAFSLVEILVVLAIIAILAALAFPVGRGMILKGQKAASASNLRQIGAAMMAHVADNDGYLPPPLGMMKDANGQPPQYLWAAHLLPYTGGNTKIFDRPGLKTTWSDPRAVDPATEKPLRIGYWINGGNDPSVAFPHGPNLMSFLQRGLNSKKLLVYSNPSRTVALVDGIGGDMSNAWNRDSRGKWKSGENSKFYRWSTTPIDGNGLAADGNPPKGSFNVLWLDGRVSTEIPESLQTSDFEWQK